MGDTVPRERNHLSPFSLFPYIFRTLAHNGSKGPSNGDGDFDIMDFFITEFAITIFHEIYIMESNITKKGK